MIYSRILGTGSYLPDKVLTNHDLEQMVDTSDEWIMKRVGVSRRHIVEDGKDTTSSMAIKAARLAITDAGLKPDDIDLVVVGTVSSEFNFPSVACLIQHELGINNESPAFDVSAACAGFIYALSVSDQFIKGGQVKNALVVGVEALTKSVDWTDRATCILFGDGAGAVVLQASDQPGVIATKIHAAGRYSEMLYVKHSNWYPEPQYIHMDGGDVFKLAVTKLNEIVDQTLDLAGMKKSDIDWLIPHQANMRIIKAIAKRLDMPMDRVILTIETHGNTSSASVPLALDHAVSTGKIQRGDTIMLEAFGAGLAWGAVLLTY